MRTILPGSTIGVLGSGQLGRMFAISARRMGYRVHTFSPDRDSPTGQIADLEIDAPYEDLDRVREFAKASDVVTFEFENVPAATADAAASAHWCGPQATVLHTTQHRLREKTFLRDHGFPVTRFDAIRADDSRMLADIGPAILKTAGFGYDGKGQFRVGSLAEAEAAWDAMGRQEAVLEALVDFEAELSVVGVRGADGRLRFLCARRATSTLPAFSMFRLRRAVRGTVCARRPSRSRVACSKQLDVTGVLCVEFFLARDGRLLINELAPRPHNSGHLTIDACITSQFEQQLRAVCGLPLAARKCCGPRRWRICSATSGRRRTALGRGLALPEVKLHLYGKLEPRPGRKMGHLDRHRGHCRRGRAGRAGWRGRV